MERELEHELRVREKRGPAAFLSSTRRVPVQPMDGEEPPVGCAAGCGATWSRLLRSLLPCGGGSGRHGVLDEEQGACCDDAGGELAGRPSPPPSLPASTACAGSSQAQAAASSSSSIAGTGSMRIPSLEQLADKFQI